MRTPVLSALLGLSLAACVGAVPGDPVGGGGDDTGSNTGSNTGSGSNVPDPVPAVAIAVDHTTLTSDLGVANLITVTATGSMGFSGAVTLTASAVDPTTGTVLADWPVAIDNGSLSLDTDGTATAKVTVNLPGDVSALMGNIKISAASSVTIPDTTVAFTANPALDVVFADNGAGTAVYPTPTNFKLKLGRTFNVLNGSPTQVLRVHVGANGDTGIQGFSHQGNPSPVGGKFSSTPSGTGTATFYCHYDAGTGELQNPGGTLPTLTVL